MDNEKLGLNFQPRLKNINLEITILMGVIMNFYTDSLSLFGRYLYGALVIFIFGIFFIFKKEV